MMVVFENSIIGGVEREEIRRAIGFFPFV
jgi:hypothetical protein